MDRPWSTVWRVGGGLWRKQCKSLWLEAVARYAELQRGERAHVDEHLAGGVPDQRLAVLQRDYADLLERDELPWRDDRRGALRRFEPRFAELCAALDVVTFNVADEGHDEIRDVYLEAYGGDREEFERALRVGRISHIFKWIRIRDVLPPAEQPQLDDWIAAWIDIAVAQA